MRACVRGASQCVYSMRCSHATLQYSGARPSGGGHGSFESNARPGAATLGVCSGLFARLDIYFPFLPMSATAAVGSGPWLVAVRSSHLHALLGRPPWPLSDECLLAYQHLDRT